MKRDPEAKLLAFCAEQKKRFSVQSWTGLDAVSREELGTAALFLSGVSWYGHRERLLEAAVMLLGSETDLLSLTKKTRFDLSRFSNMLRRALKEDAGAL